jgi:hypothetical protein
LRAATVCREQYASRGAKDHPPFRGLARHLKWTRPDLFLIAENFFGRCRDVISGVATSS